MHYRFKHFVLSCQRRHELFLSCRFDQLQPKKHGVEFRRPTTLARGDPLCDFILQKVPRQRISRGAAPFQEHVTLANLSGISSLKQDSGTARICPERCSPCLNPHNQQCIVTTLSSEGSMLSSFLKFAECSTVSVYCLCSSKMVVLTVDSTTGIISIEIFLSTE